LDFLFQFSVAKFTDSVLEEFREWKADRNYEPVEELDKNSQLLRPVNELDAAGSTLLRTSSGGNDSHTQNLLRSRGEPVEPSRVNN